MSVILTAGRHSVKAKTKAKKHKKKHVQEEAYQPPISTPKTIVWFWKLDNTLTTVMFTKAYNEVWCNGKVLSTDSYFHEYGNINVTIEFTIMVEHMQHSAVIVKRIIDDSHEMFVDGFLVHNNIGQHPEESITMITMEEYYGQPPSYESIITAKQ